MRELSLKVGLTLLLFAPLVMPYPYGANRPAGALRVQVGAYLILALVVLGARRLDFLRRVTIPVALAMLLVALGIFQILPLPTTMIESLSPRSASVWSNAENVLALFDRTPPPPRISIVPWETLQMALLIVAWVALFVASFTVSRERRRAGRWILMMIAAAGAIHALHATIMIRFPNETDVFGGRAHGTFINPNHLAAYLTIYLAAAYALLLVEVLYLMTGHRPRPASQAYVVVGLFITTTVVLIIGTGILLSQSRGGIAAAVLMLAFMTVAVLFHPRVRTRRRSLVGGMILVALIVSAGSVYLGDRSTLYRFLSVDPRDASSDSRTQYWSAAIEAWNQYPVFGSGLGTFREAFRQVQPPSDRGSYITHAHNDPLELLVTGGAIGFAIGALGFVSIIVLLTRSWWNERHREQSAWILAGIAAVLAVSLHSLVEFPFTIPAIPAALAILLGSSWSAGEGMTERKPG